MKLFYICCTMRMVTSNMIKSLRKSRNLTQEQLGILSGMSKSHEFRKWKWYFGQ